MSNVSKMKLNDGQIYYITTIPNVCYILAVADFVGWSEEKVWEVWTKSLLERTPCFITIEGPPPEYKTCPRCGTAARVENTKCMLIGCDYVWAHFDLTKDITSRILDKSELREYNLRKNMERRYVDALKDCAAVLKFCPECGAELVKRVDDNTVMCVEHGEFVIVSVYGEPLIRWDRLRRI